MIDTCDKFLNIINLLGVYLTVAVCTCEPYSSHCSQFFAESIPIFGCLFHSYYMVIECPSLFLGFPNLLGMFGRCPSFASFLAAFLGLFFAVVKSIGNRARRRPRRRRRTGSEYRYCADGACDRKRDDSTNGC